MNARVSSGGKMETEGNQIEIGGNERYVSLCRNCFSKKKNRNIYRNLVLKQKLTTKRPPISKMPKTKASMLKCLSIFSFRFPEFCNEDSYKKRTLRITNSDAIER